MFKLYFVLPSEILHGLCKDTPFVWYVALLRGWVGWLKLRPEQMWLLLGFRLEEYNQAAWCMAEGL